MSNFDPQTSVHINRETGQITSGAAARNVRIAEAGGQDQVQQKAYDQGYRDGHARGFAEGFDEGSVHGAERAYERVEKRLQQIESALLQRE